VSSSITAFNMDCTKVRILFTDNSLAQGDVLVAQIQKKEVRLFD